MTDNNSAILCKIKKCLALSASSNPHEAAAALRQAHALMNKHGVSAHEVTMADIGEARLEARPTADLCISCKELSESKENLFAKKRAA